MLFLNRWDRRFVQLAQHVAGWSKDPSKKVGAVLVGADRRDVALGYNGFPPGIRDDDRLEDRETKLKLVMHAERNVLDNAKFSVIGGTLYTTFSPCTECTKSVISRGLAKIVTPVIDPTNTRWCEDFQFARSMLKEAGIIILEYKDGPTE